jgi:hypothetical protein
MKEKIKTSDYSSNNTDIHRDGDTLSINLTYPPYTNADNEDGRVRYVEIDQESVRASDGIRVSYDYERDGWKIEQATAFQWDVDDETCDPRYVETAFVPSWPFGSPSDEDYP